MSARVLGCVLAVLVTALPAAAGVRAVLVSEIGDPVGGGGLHAPSVFFVGGSDPGEITVGTTDFTLAFRAPAGEALAPGSYESATSGTNHQPGDPAISVFTGVAQGCDFVTGRFDVLELTRYQSGSVRSFAVDFEQRCEGGPPLRGSIRWSPGAAACQGASVGTPCDDLDACTPSSTCDGVFCVSAPIAPCTGTESCEVSVCDPTTAACLGVVAARDDTPCDDGEPCTEDETCRAGVCTGGRRPFCTDGDQCTDDFCTDGVGCVAAPMPGRCGAPGEPTSVLYVERTGWLTVPDARRRWTSADGDITVDIVRPGARRRILRIFATGPDTWASLAFAVPGQLEIRPGTYVGATDDPDPTRPHLDVDGGGACPNGAVGRFTVLVADWAPTGELLRFAADFTQHCRGAETQPTMRGAVRWRTGDLACRTAPDGTPCDPLDACVGAASCRDGVCVATEVTTCDAPGICQDVSACDPRTGACAAPVAARDGSECDDGDPCTTTSACAGGACVGADPLDCDDRNVCTADACTPGVGCTSTPIAGSSCWTLDGTTTFTVSGNGRSCRCSRPVHRTMALFENGGFVTAGADCIDPAFGGVSVTVPDEVGLWFPTRAGRIDLEPLNLAAVADGTNRCVSGSPTGPLTLRRRVQLRDGQLREKGSVVFARRAGRTVRATTRLTGVPGDGVRAPDTLPMFGEWDACLPKLRRCLR